ITMPLYENVFIARQDISGAQVDALADGFTQLIAEQGGEIKKREYWVLRYLTLRVDQLEEGPSPVMQSRGSREDRPRRDRDRYERYEREPDAPPLAERAE